MGTLNTANTSLDPNTINGAAGTSGQDIYLVGKSINPKTGKPFQSQQEIDDYTASQGYNWSGVSGYWQGDANDRDKNIYFGQTYETPQDLNGGSGNGQIIAPDAYKLDWESRNGGAGYIDPSTGQIHLYSTTSVPNANDSPNGPGDTSNPSVSYKSSDYTKQYDAWSDYGLGPGSEGIMVLGRDKNGTPTAFYAATAGGGGQVFNSLADAQAAVTSYKSWYLSENPTARGQTPSATTASTTGNGTAGLLTTPGAGETYYDSTKDFYGQGTNAQQAWNDVGRSATQPTNAQQTWNGYAGKFNDPNYLNGIYQQAADRAEVALDRKASSAGWGDSGAAARATADIPLNYQNAATQATENWASTGATIAGQADAANVAKTNQVLNAANSSDAANLARVAAGQTAATSAENQQINRETGGLTSAIQLGDDQSMLMYSGLSAAQQEQLQGQMAALALQVQQGTLTTQQAYQNAQSYLSGIGAVANAATSAYIQNKLGSKS